MYCYKCGKPIDDDSRYCEYCGTKLLMMQTDGNIISPPIYKAHKFNTLNGYEYVDLGLPSGLKWATCNIGAKCPEEYGDYFAWGETKPKNTYKESNSILYGMSISQWHSSGIIDNRGNLAPSYDAASYNWGGSWRMPTLDEVKELLVNTMTVWTIQNGVYGCKVTSKLNGRSFFLPAAGYRYGGSFCNDGKEGGYWLSSPNEDRAQGSYDLYFSSINFEWNFNLRYFGQSVRPVSK